MGLFDIWERKKERKKEIERNELSKSGVSFHLCKGVAR